MKGVFMNTSHGKLAASGSMFSLIILGAWIAAMAAHPLPAAETADANSSASPQVRRPAMETVRIISFRLKDGRTVSGRVTSDDRAQVTVSEPVAGTFATTSYSRLDIEPRSIAYQSLSEFQYWLNMGQHFDGRTWDFMDDAEEFAQALRCYQTARDLAAASTGSEGPVARDVELRIGKLLESRKRWIEDAEPRAKMAELEFKITLSTRLDEMSARLASLQNSVEQMEKARSGFETALANYQRDVDSRLARMADDIRRNYEYTRDTGYGYRTVVVPGTTTTPK